MSLQKLLVILVVGLLLSLTRLHAKGLVFSDAQILEISQIAKDISALQPGLPKMKYFEFAIGIFEACNKYGIDPQLLVAITAQESSFREGLPEGAAGEWGMTQIRKNWLANKTFRTEFPNASEASLKRPETSFRYSAWLLSHLKISEAPKKLPYWTYYNARSYSPRFRYYLRVNKKLGKIRRLRATRMNKLKRMMGGSERTLASASTPAPNKKILKRKTARRVASTKKRYRKRSRRVARARVKQVEQRSVTKLSPSQRRRALEQARQRRLAKVHAEKQQRALQALRKKRIAPVLEVAQNEPEAERELKPARMAKVSFGKEVRTKKRRTRVRRVRRSEIYVPPSREEKVKSGYISAALKDVNREYQERKQRYEETGMVQTSFNPSSMRPRTGSTGYVAPAVRGTANQLGIQGAY